MSTQNKWGVSGMATGVDRRRMGFEMETGSPPKGDIKTYKALSHIYGLLVDSYDGRNTKGHDAVNKTALKVAKDLLKELLEKIE